MEASVKGRERKFTDQALRACVAEGLKQADIARRFRVSQAAVSQRLKQLKLTTTSSAVAPVESNRHVRAQVDVMEQLALNLKRANLLMDACHRWLQDADAPERYDVGPRADEVEVTYRVEVTRGDRLAVETRKKPLSELLGLLGGEIDAQGGRIIGVDRGEYKHADPRELILKTHSETRLTAALVVEAMQKLLDARVMEQWRVAVLEEIARESPDCASRIAERVRQSIVLHAAFSGPGSLLAESAGESN